MHYLVNKFSISMKAEEKILILGQSLALGLMTINIILKDKRKWLQGHSAMDSKPLESNSDTMIIDLMPIPLGQAYPI